ncbi:flagellar assembly protein FliH [Cytobacillus sp. Hm23]
MSKVIKAPFANVSPIDKKVIGLQSFSHPELTEHQSNNNEDWKQISQQMLAAAEQEAMQMKKQADMYVNQITEAIEADKTAWESEKQQLIAAAKTDGYSVGLQSGKQDGYAQYTKVIDEAQAIVNMTKRDYHEKLDSTEETTLKLGMLVAERILGQHLEENKEHYVQIVKRALKEVKEHSDIKIYVHPSYYELVANNMKELLDIVNHNTDIYVYPDEERNETSCIIESSFGKIDASIDSQLKEIKTKLFDLLVEE